MTEVRYATVVTAVGAQVPEFAASGMLIFFAEGAPAELHDFCVLHRPAVTAGGVAPGDVVRIDDVELEVTAVGDVANENLVALGHLDLKADGSQVAPLPGDVCVSAGPLPEIGPGSSVAILAAAATPPAASAGRTTDGGRR